MQDSQYLCLCVGERKSPFLANVLTQSLGKTAIMGGHA